MKEIGIYIHIPFCIRKCNYCDFCSVEIDEDIVEQYVSALIKEMLNYKETVKNYSVKSVFIGGGTPSLISVECMEKIIAALYKIINLKSDMEFTIESNPGTLNKEKIKFYHASGINRLSIGLQAWQNSLLKKLGRIHTSQEFEESFFIAREFGFENINVDLMFGIPDQTLADWNETLLKTIALKPEHISAYSLKVEENTTFGKLYEDGKLNLPSEENDRLMYYKTINYLEANNYNHYEISNFAIEGKECIHNNIYWNNEEYLGFGLSAHSYLHQKRFSNEEHLATYINTLNENRSPKVFEYKNSLKEQIEETMFLGLRRIRGININEFTKLYGKSPMEIYSMKLKNLEEKGLLRVTDTNIALTSKGHDLSNKVFAEFLLDEKGKNSV